MLARQTLQPAAPESSPDESSPDGPARDVLVFGGRLALAVLGGLALLAMVLALVITAWVSSLSHQHVQRATSPLAPRAAAPVPDAEVIPGGALPP